MKPNDVVNDAVKDLTAQLKEIKGIDEDDLSKLSQLFDNVAQHADETATRLSDADNALSGEAQNASEGDEKEQESDGQEG
jgi:U3 small nucleolar RNA-associated protein 14